MNYAVGIDYSLTNTGVALLNGEGHFQYSFLIKPPAQKKTRTAGYPRVMQICHDLEVELAAMLVRGGLRGGDKVIISIEDYNIGRGKWGGMNNGY